MRLVHVLLCCSALAPLTVASRPGRTLWSLRGGVENFSRRTVTARPEEDPGRSKGNALDDDVPDAIVATTTALPSTELFATTLPWDEDPEDPVGGTTLQDGTTDSPEDLAEETSRRKRSAVSWHPGGPGLSATRPRRASSLEEAESLRGLKSVGGVGVGAGVWGKHVRAPMQKVSLTQIGYIQFLRYVADVPNLRELSFCIWLRSRNLTHNQPLFSYSKDEKTRLARVWVSPATGPRSPPRLHFKVLERAVFSEPLPEAAHHRWMHICPSWDGYSGTWHLYVDGKLRRTGERKEVSGLTLPKGGDVVVGQEYTDFDKGLDDGVEGEVFGFYLFQSANFGQGGGGNGLDGEEAQKRVGSSGEAPAAGRRGRSLDKAAGSAAAEVRRRRYGPRVSRGQRARQWIPHMLAQLPQLPKLPPFKSVWAPPRNFMRRVPERVQRLYALCTEQLAAEDKRDLVVSWTHTTVRVFGGAIISNVREECGNF